MFPPRDASPPGRISARVGMGEDGDAANDVEYRLEEEVERLEERIRLVNERLDRVEARLDASDACVLTGTKSC